MLRDTNSRSPISPEREVGLQVREQPELRWGEGRSAGHCACPRGGEDRAEGPSTSSTRVPSAGRWSRMSSISRRR